MGKEAEDWTVLKLLNWTKDYFARSNVDSPRLAAEVLLAHALGCKRIELYARFDTRPSPDLLAVFRQYVQRAAAHEPVAYIVGRKEFYSLDFKVTRDVLVPRPETEILVEQAVAHLRHLGRQGTLWDICTGSGCIAAAAAHQVKDLRAVATDISPAAIAVAQENMQALGLADRVSCRVADLATLPEDSGPLAPFDVITANPPYVAANADVAPEVKHEPQSALLAGKDGLDIIKPLIAQAHKYLRPGAILALEFGYDQADAVRDLIAACGAYHEPRLIRDHQQIERSAVAVKK
jgi:release factor glutamine methyltransferase